MEGRSTTTFNAQEYLGSYAEYFVDYIVKAAGDNIQKLFDVESTKRFLLEDNELVKILKDQHLQADLDLKLTEWKFVAHENAIKQTRTDFRTYYFAPILAHPKWQAFLAKHPDTSSTILDSVSGAFFYWILQLWIEAQTDITLRKKVQPLITIVNSTRSDAMVRKELEKNLINKLQSEFDTFFRNFADFTSKKEDIGTQVESKLLTLQELYQPQFENIKLILWKRLDGFLANQMRYSNHFSIESVPDDAAKHKSKRSKPKTSNTDKELKPDIKNEIAKGILEYFQTHTTQEERVSEKNGVTMINIFNSLYLQVSKDKHKKYEALFSHTVENMQKSPAQTRRGVYGKQRNQLASQTVSDLKYNPRQFKINNLSSTSTSVLPIKCNEDSDIPDLPAIAFDTNKRARDKTRIFSPRDKTAHFRDTSFFKEKTEGGTAEAHDNLSPRIEQQ